MAKIKKPKRIAWESAAAVGSLRYWLEKEIEELKKEAEMVWSALQEAAPYTAEESEFFRVFAEMSNEVIRLEIEYEGLPPWE